MVGAVAARMVAGTKVLACPLMQVPPAQPSRQTAVPGLTAEATVVSAVLRTGRGGGGLRAEGVPGNSLGGSLCLRGIKGVADGNSINAPACLVGIH